MLKEISEIVNLPPVGHPATAMFIFSSLSIINYFAFNFKQHIFSSLSIISFFAFNVKQHVLNIF